MLDKGSVDKERRAFLKRVINSFFTLLILIFPFFVLYLLKPKNPKKKQYEYYEIPMDSIPRQGIKKINIFIKKLNKAVKIYLVNDGNSLFALSPVCTHLGCFVNFDRQKNEFLCPCHGGRYDVNGNVIAGPPKEPLRRLPVKIEGDKLFIGVKL